MSEALKELDLYQQMIAHEAVVSGLSWETDAAKIQALTRDVSSTRQALELPIYTDGTAVNGTYWGAEDLCGVWMVGVVEQWPFARQVLDFIASELGVMSSFAKISNIHGLVTAFGPEIVEPVFDLVRDLFADVRVETQHMVATVRDETTEAEHEIFGSLGPHDDHRFDEAVLRRCEPDAEGATLITYADLDMADFQSICEFIETRDALARRALRGER